MAGRCERPPPKRKRRPGQEAAHLENNSSNAPGYTQPSSREQGFPASGGRYDPPADDFQHAELAAARYLVRRHFLRPAVAKVIADELRLALLAGAAR